MKHAVTADDILHSIEFELAQGAISRTDLGDGLNSVRQFQNKARTATFESDKVFADTRALITQQYQINDMHLTLLQELTAAVQAVQLDVRRVSQLPPRPAPAISTTTSTASSATTAQPTVPPQIEWFMDDVSPLWPNAPIENAMRPDTLKLKIDVRPSATPLMGGLLRRVRAAFHNLTLFYLQQIGQKQTSVNQIYGERLLQLTDLVQQQQQQIEALHAQVAALAALAGRPHDS
jgi:hypothetical protein